MEAFHIIESSHTVMCLIILCETFCYIYMTVAGELQWRTASEAGTTGGWRIFEERVKRLIWLYINKLDEVSKVNS